MLLLAPSVHAFCGYYAGDDGQAITNASSIVVLAHDGDRVSLTLANDFDGPTTSFALLIPVPEVLDASKVREIDPTWLDRLDAYSAPRRVQYPCYDDYENYDDYDGEGSSGGFCGCGGAALDTGSSYKDTSMADTADAEQETVDTTVTVENEFATSTYTFQILSAEESDGLLTWLADGGYVLPEAASSMLQEYIDGGTFFMVVKVNLEAELPERAWLPPIQLDYAATNLSLPIRLGTLSSAGQQDLLVYTLTSASAGATGIANYEEALVETECTVDQDDDFTAFYEEQFSSAMANVTGAGWVREYAWRSEQCDPCTSEPLDNATVQAFGRSTAADTVLTRLHMRYEPGEIDEDLTLYESGIEENIQMRYIEDEGCPDGYGVCDGLAMRPQPTPWAPAGSLAGIGVAVGLRRRRQRGA